MNPSLQVTVNRKMLQPITLSNGVTLPKGTSVAVSAACASKDPAIFENPEEFDGFRYHNLRQKEENDAKYQFATIGSDALSFGTWNPIFCLGSRANLNLI
jgi:cytochrome P450